MQPKKIALITGVTGQDGSYLAEFLLAKGYQVHGIKRRSSQLNTARIDHIYEAPYVRDRNFVLHYGDLSDSSNITRIIQQVQPNEVYNLGAQSHVAVSFEQPEYTADVEGLGTLRILEALRLLGMTETTRFYQASTSELYGLVHSSPQTETTPFHPRSPYAVAKLYAYWITVNYRESYGMYACNGILYNHESPRRGETFVSRKITRGLSQVSQGIEPRLYLGNLDALRDWGHAKDYVEMQWLMLQQDQAEDYVIATGRQASVRDFVQMTAGELGFTIEFSGSGLEEVGRVASINPEQADPNITLQVGDIVLAVDSKYYRPAEVDSLLGDASKARNKLGWTPSHTLEQLVAEMAANDLQEARKFRLLQEQGFNPSNPNE